MSELQENLYRVYEKSLGKDLLEVKEEEKVPPEEGQVRLFFMTPPEFILVLKKEGDLNVIVPLTSYIQLAITNIYPPLIKWKGFRLVPLPFWVYANEKIIQKYSVPVFKLSNLEKIREYVKSARTKGIGKWREKFIKKVAERYKDLNLSSLIYEVMKAEEERKALVIEFPAALKERFESREEILLAAQPQNYLKGRDWLGVVENGVLFLYLPEEYSGKRIRISLGEEVIYEGEATALIKIENLPELPSYGFLEEELNVQVLGD
ncbi:hypothetical protein BCF55_0965 [Hydrogenivirga caldilitoris]|uniref:Uncharacterized protein n=1 Tax=Hydrogenivirga caldilitoris TaxID=246264 RepID=A0A497XR01_9AQUI|nr:hypothetical protein [Hydrogenivirga caldilitoris]RLJ70684.1 hypothetical protein BCF55_0965 [Hydrogenivirga caldilitoris]